MQAASDMEERVSTLPESDVRRLIPVCFNQIIASRRNADLKGQEVHQVRPCLIVFCMCCHELRVRLIQVQGGWFRV